jgi:hypothetical protein
MRTSSKFLIGSALLFLVMSLGSFCYAQYTAPEKPAEQAAPGKATEPTAPGKPGQKVIPEDLTADLNTSFYSKYVWRGLELSKDSLVIFPSMTIGYKGFAFNIWVDFDTDFNNPPATGHKESKLQETDLTLSYTNKIKPLKMDYTVGWIYYDTDGFYGDVPSKNQEVFVTLAFDLPLKPTLSVYREIEIGEAWYTSLALSHSFSVCKNWSLDVGGWVSYLYNHSTEDFSAMHDANLWVGLTIPLNPFWSLTPKMQYSFPLSSSASDRIEANSFNGRDDKFIYGGLIFDRKF